MNPHNWRPVATIQAEFRRLGVTKLELFIDAKGDQYALIGANTGLILVDNPADFVRQQAEIKHFDGVAFWGIPAENITVHDPELMP